jgi:hypothetical protein
MTDQPRARPISWPRRVVEAAKRNGIGPVPMAQCVPVVQVPEGIRTPAKQKPRFTAGSACFVCDEGEGSDLNALSPQASCSRPSHALHRDVPQRFQGVCCVGKLICRGKAKPRSIQRGPAADGNPVYTGRPPPTSESIRNAPTSFLRSLRYMRTNRDGHLPTVSANDGSSFGPTPSV